MQAGTHLLAGAILEQRLHRRWLAVPIAVASHIVLDDLARLTYHPADPSWTDPFWVGYHAAHALLALSVVVILRRHWLGMAAACLPDLDWVGRGFTGRVPGLHEALERLPGFAQWGALCERLPYLRHAKAAALVEVALLALLVALARRGRERADLHHDDAERERRHDEQPRAE